MKRDSETPESAFNPPAAVAARALFVLFLLVGPSAGGLFVVGTFTHNVPLLSYGLAGIFVAVLIYSWLRREGRLVDAMRTMDAFDEIDLAEAPADFTRLVRAWDDLEVLRGKPGFDPWQLLNLRREIEARARANPKLADYWRDHCR